MSGAVIVPFFEYVFPLKSCRVGLQVGGKLKLKNDLKVAKTANLKVSLRVNLTVNLEFNLEFLFEG